MPWLAVSCPRATLGRAWRWSSHPPIGANAHQSVYFTACALDTSLVGVGRDAWGDRAVSSAMMPSKLRFPQFTTKVIVRRHTLDAIPLLISQPETDCYPRSFSRRTAVFHTDRPNRTNCSSGSHILGSVHLASRIEVFPAGTTGSGASPRPSTIYFYIGLDCSGDDTKDGEPCLGVGGKSGGGLAVVDDDSEASSPRRSLLIRGAHPQHGGFELEAGTVAKTQDGGGLSLDGGGGGDGGLTFAFVGKKGAPIADIKQEVEKMHEAHRRTSRRPKKKNEAFEPRPFVLPNEADVDSNVVLVQVRKNHFRNERFGGTSPSRRWCV